MFAEYQLRPPAFEDSAARSRLAADPQTPLALVTAPLHSGFVWPEAKLAFITEAELYAGVVRHRRDGARRSSVEGMVRDLSNCASAIRWCTSSTASAATWA